jgi:putative endonuclease
MGLGTSVKPSLVILSAAKDLSAVTQRIYHVYIMASASRRLYVGVTGHLARRVHQHREREIAGFTSKYQMVRLVYAEPTEDVLSAIRREKQIKGWVRAKKIALIESLNPEWRDLGAELLGGLQRDPSLRSG